MIVRFDKQAVAQSQNAKGSAADSDAAPAKVSEVDKIVMDTKQKIADGIASAVGISASNSGRGYEPIDSDDVDFMPTTLDGTLEEEPGVIGEDDSPEVTPGAEKELAAK